MRTPILLLLLCLSPVCLAKPKSEPVQTAPAGASIGNDWLRFSISTDEQRILRDWRQRQPQSFSCTTGGGKALPKGQQKKMERTGEVSAGWQKKIARGETMPADVVQQCRTSLPPELVRRLPPAPPGTILIGVEGKAVRLLEATREILDVFDF